MIAAVLADVHGNLAALEAVLADLPSIDRLICCGDLVGYYPDAPQVVDRLRALDVRAVRGNHELMVCGRRSVPADRAHYYRAEWTREALSRDQLAWLDALPPSVVMLREGLCLRIRHASPWDEDSYLYPDSPALHRIHLAAGTSLLLGHTHYPMRIRRGQGWVINPGAVGQPRDWDPRAAYGILDMRTGGWEQRRVTYDHRAYQRRLESLGWDPGTIALLGRQRDAAAR